MRRPVRWSLYSVGVIIAVVAVLYGYELLLVRATFEHVLPESRAPATAITLGPKGHRIVGRDFITGTVRSEYALVVVLHGDAPTRNPGYQYSFATKLADAFPGLHVVALIRPGYSDPFGLRSDGDRGFAAGENYTPIVVGDVAAAIDELAHRLRASSVVLVGHSGGAAIAANIAALSPGLVDWLFLVACPCDVQAFRHHMATFRHDPLFWLPSSSLSPLITLQHMHSDTSIMAITGETDPIALPQYARDYIEAARRQGLSASLTILPKLGHEILEEAAVIDAVGIVVRSEAQNHAASRVQR